MSLRSPAGDAILSQGAISLAKQIDGALRDDCITPIDAAAFQFLMAALCKYYSAQHESGIELLPFGRKKATSGTEVLRMASGLLNASGIDVFELAMWQAREAD